jgi:hypothetical protein
MVFKGKKDKTIPEMNGTYIESVSERYIEGTRKFLG